MILFTAFCSVTCEALNRQKHFWGLWACDLVRHALFSSLYSLKKDGVTSYIAKIIQRTETTWIKNKPSRVGCVNSLLNKYIFLYFTKLNICHYFFSASTKLGGVLLR